MSLDLRFVDLKGVWRHQTLTVSSLSAKALEKGFALEHQGLPGWDGRAALLLKPQLITAVLDPSNPHDDL